MEFLTGLIRYIHIFSAVMWVGGIFFWGMLVVPTIQKRVPPAVGGPFMATIFMRVVRYLTIAGVLTLLSGVGLLADISGGNLRAGFEQGLYGISMTLGLVTAIVMLVIAFTVIKPTGAKMMALAKNAPAPAPGATPAGPPPAIKALQKRLMMAGMANLLLSAFALAMMVTAVNVGFGG